MPSFSVFDRASPELVQWLDITGNTSLVEASTTVIQEGERPDHLAIILDGRLTATTTDQRAQQEQLATLTRGSLVGEMSWLEQRPAVATISAAEECRLLQLPHSTLDRLGDEHPQLSAELHRLIAQKLAVQIKDQNTWAHRLHKEPDPVEALRKVLILFANLQEQDVHWLARLGRVQRLQPKAVLLKQGDDVPNLYLLLSGEAEILLTISGDTQVVGSSRRGELLGEMSLLLEEQRGAAAGVQSAQGMDLLTIQRSTLLAELERNPPLASRFYRGLACMLSQRSRDQLLSHQRGTTSQLAEQDAIDRLELDQLEAISRAARHFDWLCRHCQTGGAASS
jgi:bacteriocin-type transport-associated protein